MNQNELNQKITSLQTGLSNAMKKIENLANEEKQIPKTQHVFTTDYYSIFYKQ